MSLSSSFYPQRPQAQFDRCNRFKRALWSLVWLCLFRPSPRIAFAWRRGLLRLFGARLAATAQVYPSTRVWAPWNLAMHAHAVLGESVDCQSVGLIEIGADVAVNTCIYVRLRMRSIVRITRPRSARFASNRAAGCLRVPLLAPM